MQQFDTFGNPNETYIKALEERRVRLETIDEESDDQRQISSRSSDSRSRSSNSRSRGAIKSAMKVTSARKESSSGLLGILDSLMSTGDGSTKSNKIFWFISFLWFLSCIFGLIHQVITISDGYFRYSVTTETAIQVAAKVRPPAMSLCFTLVDIRIRTEFPEDSPCFKRTLLGEEFKNDHQNCLSEFQNMSMRGIKRRTLEFEDVVEQIWYREPITYEEVLLNRSNGDDGYDDYVDKHVSTVIKGDLLCYRMRPLVNYSSDDYNSFVINDNRHQGAILSVYFNLTTLKDANLARLYMHLPSTYPRGYLISPLIYNVTSTERFVTSYSKIVNNFLPPPFASACHDYLSKKIPNKFIDQKECVEICLDNSTFNPQDYVYPTTVKYEFDHKKLDLDMKDIAERVNCYSKCPMNCRDVSFYPKKMTRIEKIIPVREIGSWRTTPPLLKDSVLSLASSDPEITVTFNARTELFEYVIYIASCFSLWFGGAVYSSTLSILFSFMSLLQKYLGIKKQHQEERRKSEAVLLQNERRASRTRCRWILAQNHIGPDRMVPWYREKSDKIKRFVTDRLQTLVQRTKEFMNE